MVMRTGNSNFNWVVIDINGIMANRGKVWDSNIKKNWINIKNL